MSATENFSVNVLGCGRLGMTEQIVSVDPNNRNQLNDVARRLKEENDGPLARELERLEKAQKAAISPLVRRLATATLFFGLATGFGYKAHSETEKAKQDPAVIASAHRLAFDRAADKLFAQQKNTADHNGNGTISVSVPEIRENAEQQEYPQALLEKAKDTHYWGLYSNSSAGIGILTLFLALTAGRYAIRTSREVRHFKKVLATNARDQERVADTLAAHGMKPS